MVNALPLMISSDPRFRLPLTTILPLPRLPSLSGETMPEEIMPEEMVVSPLTRVWQNLVNKKLSTL